MRAAQIELKQEVTRNDALVIMNWMENNEVTKYLNEASNITQEIKEAIDRVNMYIMTHLFNRDGSFYLIHSDNDPMGFLKLVRRSNEVEMVIVIGSQNNWGQGWGQASIRKGLDIAFFQWRTKRVIAKIDPANTRSIKAFENIGFVLEKEQANNLLYSLSFDDYLAKLI